MSDPLDQVKQRLADAMAKGSILDDTILYVFVLLRQHLELTPAANGPTVRHYANWLVHPKLSRAPTGSLLDEATAVLGPPTEMWVNDRVIQTFRLKELRQEIRILLAGHSTATLFESHNFWKAFLGFVFKALEGKRLERMKPPATSVGGLYIQSLAIATSREPDAPGRFTWTAHIMPKNALMLGPLSVPESRADFLTD